jgi:hypothetical protein
MQGGNNYYANQLQRALWGTSLIPAILLGPAVTCANVSMTTNHKSL